MSEKGTAMTYQVRTETRPAARGPNGRVYILEEAPGGGRAEIRPGAGFNCFRWQVPGRHGPLDVLYSAADFFEGDKPTRSGIPILFPFPNRIRGGRFRWEGKEYSLPLNDSAGKNAIHGFARRKPWRVVDQGTEDQSAWLTGEFCASADVPDSRDLWPADYCIRVTYRLGRCRLGLEIRVENSDRVPLPFGLGFHPYVAVPVIPGGQPEQCWVETRAGAFWELEDGLPTGKRLALSSTDALGASRRFSELTADDLLTGFRDGPEEGTAGLALRASLRQMPGGVSLELLTSADFRELVIFTPPHRQAVCLEPYTCTTDAINLQQRGVDAGLLVLPPGKTWDGAVELKLQPLAR